jgi:ribose transport system substrate-binding protein
MLNTIRKFAVSRSRVAAALACAVGAALAPGAATAMDRYLGVLEPMHDTGTPLRYGITVVHVQDDFWKGIAYGIADEVKQSGGKVVQVTVAGKYGNVAEQFAQIDAMMTKGIDVLVVGAAAYDGFDPIFRKVREKGIKIIAAGTPVNSKLPDFGVVFSDYDVGKQLGAVLCQNRPRPDFKIIALPGPAGAEWAKLSVDGLKAAVDECPGATLELAPLGGEISIGYGLTATADMITKYPDASFVWTPTMGLGMGAIQAIRQRHADMRAVGATVLRGMFPAFEDGTLLAVDPEPSILMGRLIVQYAIRQKLGQPTPLIRQTAEFPYPMIVAPTRVITKADYQSYPWQETDVPPADWSIEAFQ